MTAHPIHQADDRRTTDNPHTDMGSNADAAFLTALTGRRDDQTLEALQSRLTEQAERAGVLDIAYRTVDSPVGELLVAATERGLVRIAYAVQDHEAVLANMADEISPRILRAPGRLDETARQLDEYFAGRRRAFEVALDMQLAHGFRRTVLDHLRGIGYGATASYGTVAARSGSPGASRAVGTACARNPLPIVVPCHRVVHADGSAGGYAGGWEAKRALLTLEADS